MQFYVNTLIRDVLEVCPFGCNFSPLSLVLRGLPNFGHLFCTQSGSKIVKYRKVPKYLFTTFNFQYKDPISIYFHWWCWVQPSLHNILTQTWYPMSRFLVSTNNDVSCVLKLFPKCWEAIPNVGKLLCLQTLLLYLNN